MTPPSFLAFRYRQTGCFAARGESGRWLAIDAGWPDSLLEYARGLKAAGGRLEEIAWALVTHFHPDHAGLIGEFQARGVECAVFPPQMAAIEPMERIIGRSWPRYRTIDPARLAVVGLEEARAWLRTRGVAGHVIATPGHSLDSVSFVTDHGEAVIGDLPLPDLVMPEDGTSLSSWAALRHAGARRIHPSHWAAFDLAPA